jgi:hypothetical protein
VSTHPELEAEAIVVCIHATRRTRRDFPHAVDGHCAACRATILIDPITIAFGDETPIYVVCPACAVQIAGPEQRTGGVVPGTIDAVVEFGLSREDAEQLVAINNTRTIADLASAALRNTVGGQG